MNKFRILEVGGNFQTSLALPLQHVDYNDFSSRDIVIVDNFITDTEKAVVASLLERGAKFVFKNLWEYKPDVDTINLILPYSKNGIVFEGSKTGRLFKGLKSYSIPMFFWYSELFGNNKYNIVDRRNFNKKFLMLINKAKPTRDTIVQRLQSQLSNAIHSYRERGTYLQDDCEVFDDRYVNLTWYEQTIFNLVVETEQMQEYPADVFLTEKTFKPISLGQPFMIIGHPNSLSLLRANGFKTFTMFNEQYDVEESFEKRLNMIADEVENFDYTKAFDDIDVIEHNHKHFHNKELVVDRIQKEIMHPLEELING